MLAFQLFSLPLCVQAPALSRHASDGKWLADQQHRAAVARAAAAVHAHTTAVLQSLPARCGGPPSFRDADAARYNSRAARAEAQLAAEAAALQAEGRRRRGRAHGKRTTIDAWRRIQAQEARRRARTHATAEERLREVNEGLAHSLERRALVDGLGSAGEPFAGSVEANITGARATLAGFACRA